MLPAVSKCVKSVPYFFMNGGNFSRRWLVPVLCIPVRSRARGIFFGTFVYFLWSQLLLASGGDLRQKTMSGMNPLMCAVQQRRHGVSVIASSRTALC